MKVLTEHPTKITRRPRELFALYENLYKHNNPTTIIKKRKSDGTIETIEEAKVPYPFKSKKPLIEIDDNANFVLKDPKAANLKKKFQRISFSPNSKSYEIDLFFAKLGAQQQIYLFLQNMNTRYLYVIPIRDKSWIELKKAFEQFITSIHPNEFHGDGESAWNSRQAYLFFEANHISTNFNSSKYIYHVKILDATMKTIRDGFGANGKLMLKNENMQQMVYFYNNTINRNTKVTPTEMETYPELERMWITHCTNFNQEQKIKQAQAGLTSYKSGNILLIHLDKSKTSHKFDKRRRSFEYIGVFQAYDHGNVRIKLLSSGLKPSEQTIIVPIYFTQKVAETIYEIKPNILNSININNNELQSLLNAEKETEPIPEIQE
jgi:hypothetical protein